MQQDKENMPVEETDVPRSEQLQEAIRFSLLTLIGITDKIGDLKPLRESETKPPEHKPGNLLDPDYNRPWWPLLAGLGGLFLGYKVLRKKD